MLQDPSAEYYGLDLSKQAGVLTGTVYPLLQRLETLGWLESAPEPIDPASAGRPQRRLYRFTTGGAALATRALSEKPSTAISLVVKPT